MITRHEWAEREATRRMRGTRWDPSPLIHAPSRDKPWDSWTDSHRKITQWIDPDQYRRVLVTRLVRDLRRRESV